MKFTVSGSGSYGRPRETRANLDLSRFVPLRRDSSRQAWRSRRTNSFALCPPTASTGRRCHRRSRHRSRAASTRSSSVPSRPRSGARSHSHRHRSRRRIRFRPHRGAGLRPARFPISWGTRGNGSRLRATGWCGRSHHSCRPRRSDRARGTVPAPPIANFAVASTRRRSMIRQTFQGR